MTYAKDGDLSVGFDGQPQLMTANTPETVDTVGEGVLVAADRAALVGGFVLGGAVIVGSGGTALLVGAGALGAYGAARSGFELADRAQHGQSISITDSQARMEWLNFAASALALPALGASVRGINGVIQGSAAATSLTSRLVVASQIADTVAVGNMGTELLSNWNDLDWNTRLQMMSQLGFYGFMTHKQVSDVGGVQNLFNPKAVEAQLFGRTDPTAPGAPLPPSSTTASPSMYAPEGGGLQVLLDAGLSGKLTDSTHGELTLPAGPVQVTLSEQPGGIRTLTVDSGKLFPTVDDKIMLEGKAFALGATRVEYLGSDGALVEMSLAPPGKPPVPNANDPFSMESGYSSFGWPTRESVVEAHPNLSKKEVTDVWINESADSLLNRFRDKGYGVSPAVVENTFLATDPSTGQTFRVEVDLDAAARGQMAVQITRPSQLDPALPPALETAITSDLSILGAKVSEFDGQTRIPFANLPDTRPGWLSTLAVHPQDVSLLPPELLADPTFLKSLQQEAPLTLVHLPEEIRADPTYFLDAVTAAQSSTFARNRWSNEALVKAIPPSLQQDAAFLTQLARINPSIAPFLGTSDAAKQAARVAIEQDPTVYTLLRLSFQRDASLAQLAIDSGQIKLNDLPVEIASQPDIARLLLKQNPRNATRLKEPLSSNERFLLEVAVDNPYVLLGASPALRSDPDFVNQLLAVNPDAVLGISGPLAQDPALRPRIDAAIDRALQLGNFSQLPISPDLIQKPAHAAAFVTERPQDYPSLSAILKENPEVLAALKLSAPAALAAKPPLLSVLQLPESLLQDPAFRVEIYRAKGTAPLGAPKTPEEAGAAVSFDPALYATLPPDLRAHPDVALQAVLHNPGLYKDLSGELQGDRRIALAAVSRDGTQIAHMLPSLAGDPEIALAALQDNPTAISMLPMGLLNDPDFARKAVALRADLAASIPSTNPARVELMRKLALTDVNYFSFLEKGDPALAEAILTDETTAIEVASKSPRHASLILGGWSSAEPPMSKDAVVAILSAQPESFPNSFMQDRPEAVQFMLAQHPDIALRAGVDGFTVEHFREAVKADPRIIMTGAAKAYATDPQARLNALATDATLVRMLPGLMDDPAFLAEAAGVNPLIYKELPADLQMKVAELNPQAKTTWEELQGKLDALNITDLGRFEKNWPLLRQIVENRTTRTGDDPRPVALVAYPKSDWNGAFSKDDLAELNKHYRVMFYEVGSKQELVQALQDGTATHPASLMIIGGHGEQGATQLGGTWQPGFQLTAQDGAFLSQAGLRQALAPDAHIILASCSTGQGQNTELNMANMFAQVAPQATVHAPRYPAPIPDITLNRDGTFQSVTYQGSVENGAVQGQQIAYNIPASQPR